MTQKFHELLLSELRMAVYEPGNSAEGTDDLICEAITLNENLQSLGYTLRPDDIVRLSASPSLQGFWEHVRALVPDVTAEPMYPGFPQEVMDMSEAEFRMHQMIHYFSTYGLEQLTGKKVGKGWLPERGRSVRDRDDTTLLESRVVELIPEGNAPYAVLEILLQRRERLTNPELALVLESAALCAPEQLRGLRIRFKENLELLFPMLMKHGDTRTALETMRALCAHAGDALRCGMRYLKQKRFHLATREKKRLVRLLESYPPKNLRDNLMMSLRARERNMLLLQYLDYNRFSRSAEHRETVRALRNGELLSWQAVGEKKLREKQPDAPAYFAQRPGYLIRSLNRLLALGYAEDAILAALMPAAGAVSGHLALRTVSAMTRRAVTVREEYRRDVAQCLFRYRMEEREPELDVFTPYFMAMERRNAAERQWLTEPEKEIREKVRAPLAALQDRLRENKKELARKKNLRVRIEAAMRGNRHSRLVQNAGSGWDDELVRKVLNGESGEELADEIARLEAESDALRLRIREMKDACDREIRKQTAEMRERNMPHYQAALRECDEFEKAERKKAEEQHKLDLLRHREAMRTLPARREMELAELEKSYLEKQHTPERDGQIVRILTQALTEHFRQAVTPLRGKKVFLDMAQFDLDHSELETENRSKDGGYIRSGISFRIPEDAKIVRFFVYWNDEERVDIDLHASGETTDGEYLHVGWNADFRKSGVIHSGDITHSDAAEYIDIDLSAPVREIAAKVNLFSGRDTLRDVQTCYVGLMAVDRAGQNVKHYNPKNCFFTHTLTQKSRWLDYGFIDVENRFVRFVGQPAGLRPEGCEGPMFSLRNYLDCLLAGQGAEETGSRAEADLILTMGKSERPDGLSLADHNFFLEC